MKRLFPLLLATLVPAAAAAGPCDKAIGKADTATGADLVAAYEDVIACDSTAADGAFPVFVRKAGGVDTAVALALVAVDHQIYTPVWGMLEGIRDYGQRGQIAEGVGAACGEHPQVVQFLQGAYYGLRDIQFVAWDDALASCDDPALLGWMESVVAAPPATTYDEKYNAVSDAWVGHRGPEALPVLQRAAIVASRNGGPFNGIIDKMEQAVRPHQLGAEIPPDDRKRLEESLVQVANEVGPEQAALVADRLYNAGAEAAAAQLLRRVYPDRVTAAGRLTYGGASIEQCDGEAVVHYAVVLEPAKRWSVLGDLEEPLRAFKPRLKCDAGTWRVVATTEPVTSTQDVDAWAEDQRARLAGEGVDAKLRKEKDVVLP